MRRRYPFEALREVRQERVDRRAVELAEQERERDRATRARERAEQARRDEQQRAADVAENERARLEQGVASAADLQAAVHFERGAAERIGQRSAAEKVARKKEDQEHTAETRARALLAQADADNQALSKHREDWERARAVAVERTADEEALDHWNTRARGRRGSGKAG